MRTQYQSHFNPTV